VALPFFLAALTSTAPPKITAEMALALLKTASTWLAWRNTGFAARKEYPSAEWTGLGALIYNGVAYQEKILKRTTTWSKMRQSSQVLTPAKSAVQ